MTAIVQGATGAILDHISNVIDGTGTNGVPGTYSHDPLVRAGLDITATANGIVTRVRYDDEEYASDRWAPANGPGFWLLCTSATNTGNVGAARKVSDFTIVSGEGDNYFTVSAFPYTTKTGDTFTMYQGFSEAPNGIDIESEFVEGFDRTFRLEMLPGDVSPYYGKGLRTYEGLVEIRLRMLKYAKDLDARRMVLENLRILRDTVSLKTNWESTYVRFMQASDGSEEIELEDEKKIVAKIGIRVNYRVDLTYN